MAKSRSDDEQKAVEGVLRGLAFTLTRLRDEYGQKSRRGEEPEGVSRGLEIALREVNDQLPRRKRVKE
jgi:ribosomal protein S19E (S16A)